MPSNSDISVRSTTRSPASSSALGRSRRRLASPRSTSTTRTPSRLNASTPSTPCPIRLLFSGIATSVKYFIFGRSPSRKDIDCRSGTRCLANSAMKIDPTAATARPTGRISKIENGSSPSLRTTPSTRMLVEVPISVSIPPITVK